MYIKPRILLFDSILFLILYQPVICNITATYYLAAMLMAGIFLMSLRERKFLSVKKELYAQWMLLVLGAAFLYCSIFHFDLHLIKQIVLLLTPVMQYWYVRVFQADTGMSDAQIAEELVKTGLFQCLLCVVMMILPQLRQMQIAYLSSFEGNQIVDAHIAGIRVFGIAGYNQYFFSMGMIHGLLSIFLVYRGFMKHRLKDMFLAVFMLLPSVLNSRTGAMMSVICMIFLLTACIIRKQGKIPQWMIPAVVLGLSGMACAVYVIRYAVPDVYGWWKQAVSVLYDLFTNNTQSQAMVWDGGLMPGNWILPKGMAFIFGTGSIPKEEYAHVQLGGLFDSGYVRIIWTGGIFLLAIVVAAYFFLVFMSRKGIAKDSQIFRFAVLFYLMLGTLKGTVYSTLPFLFLVMTISGCCKIQEKQKLWSCPDMERRNADVCI